MSETLQEPEDVGARLDRLEGRLHRWFRGVFIAIALVGVTSTLAMLGYGLVISEIQTQRREVCEAINQQLLDRRAETKLDCDEIVQTGFKAYFVP